MDKLEIVGLEVSIGWSGGNGCGNGASWAIDKSSVFLSPPFGFEHLNTEHQTESSHNRLPVNWASRNLSAPIGSERLNTEHQTESFIYRLPVTWASRNLSAPIGSERLNTEHQTESFLTDCQ